MININWPLVRAVVLMAALLVFTYSVDFKRAYGRDLGQWENSDPAIRQWYKSLMMPDVPAASCCGESDAYWADEIHVRDGRTYARITDDRPDGPLGRPHREIGEEFEIPNHKLKFSDGNPTGHAVLFLSAGGIVYCFVQGGGT